MNLIDFKKTLEGFNYEQKLEFIKNHNVGGFFLSISTNDEKEIIFNALGKTTNEIFDNYKDQEEKKQKGIEHKILISICPKCETEYNQFMLWFLENRKVNIKSFINLKEEFIASLNLNKIKDWYLEEKFNEYKTIVIDNDWALELVNGIKTVKMLGNTPSEYNYYKLGCRTYLEDNSDRYLIFSRFYFQELYENGRNSSFDVYKQKLEYFLRGQNESEFFVFLKEEMGYFNLNRNFKCLENTIVKENPYSYITIERNKNKNAKSGTNIKLYIFFMFANEEILKKENLYILKDWFGINIERFQKNMNAIVSEKRNIFVEKSFIEHAKIVKPWIEKTQNRQVIDKFNTAYPILN